MEKNFKRDIQSLDKIFEFIREFVAANAIDEPVSFSLNLAVEEIFTNMVKYNSENTKDISISLTREAKKLIVKLIDFDVEPFDITKTKEVDITQHLEKRKVGGLGIHLVKQLVDKIDYIYEDRKSIITLIKNLEN